MKTIIITLLILSNLIIFTPSSAKINDHKAVQRSGFYSINNKPMDEMPIFLQDYYWAFNKQNQNYLINKNKLTINTKVAHPLYLFPLKGTTNDTGFYGISNYVDLDSAFPNKIRDYTGGTRSYDRTNGYNHQGIDIFTWPFGWYKMDNDQVTVNAATDGVITTKIDGNQDRSCTFNGQQWNVIVVTHADGSYVYYGHMKKDSLTSKNVGMSVVAGEFLGVVGSSGISTGPHLHLETYDSNDQLIEPYSGPFNTLNADSWWLNQKPYYESRIVKLATHVAPPALAQCPSTVDTPNYQDTFEAGDLVYFVRYYQDQLKNQLSDLTIKMPDGTVFRNYSHSSSVNHYSASYWYNSYFLPADAQLGEWTFEATFEGTTTKHKFYVLGPDPIFENGFE